MPRPLRAKSFMLKHLFRSLSVLLLAVAALCLSGCKSDEITGPLYMLDFYLEASPNLPERYINKTALPLSELELTINARPILNHFSVDRVELVQVELGLAMLFQFDQLSARELYRHTAGNQGKRIVITVNGAPVGARVIDVPIANGVLMAFLEMTDEEMHELAANLQETTAKINEQEAKNSYLERKRRKDAESAKGM